MRLVFVYGSLMRGHGNHYLLAQSRFVSTARTPPSYRMHSLGGFPGVMRGGEQSIRGEVYAVDGPTLANLDRLEGHPRFYQRSLIALDDGTRVSTYLLPNDPHYTARPVVESGDWRAHKESP